MKRAAVITALMLAMTPGLAMAEVSKEQIEALIEKGVKEIVAKQSDDGHWPALIGGRAEEAHYNVGHTALAVLALQHSGSRSPEAALAIRKGLSWIIQQPPNGKTYAAGTVLQALYADNPAGHPKEASAYGWMLCGGQKLDGVQVGSWTYDLPVWKPTPGGNSAGEWTKPSTMRSDNSNSQFAILGLVFAQKMGFQVPRVVWERARKYYTTAQHADGGWDYFSDGFRATNPDIGKEGLQRAESTQMTFGGTVSEKICEEALADKAHAQCKTPAVNKVHEAGLKWIASNWPPGQGTYSLYACERLGMLIGYSEFGGHDWFQEGARGLAANGWGTDVQGTAFAVLFLARGRTPIIINKLKREGDWNLHRYDIKNVTENISGPWQMPCQWRIVTLDAKVDFLLKVPILWISGHEALTFTAEEKAKLKEYVERGGTILAEDCCSKKPFDESFRALLKELWPDSDLMDIPKTHAIFTSFRKLENPPALKAMALEKGQGRIGVIYLPNGISCRWEVGGAGARPMLDAAACIYLYVEKIGKREKTDAKS